MNTAWILARKDLKLHFRDRTGMLLNLALPVFLATIFAAAMGGMGGGDSTSRVKLYVEDLDQSDVSAALVAELEASTGLRVERASDVRRKVADGKAPAGLLIPEGFADDFGSERALPLKLYRDPSEAIEQQIVLGNLVPALVRAWGPSFGRGIVRRSLAAVRFPERGRDHAELVLTDAWQRLRAIAVENGSGSDAMDLSLTRDGAELIPGLAGLELEDVVGGDDGAAEKTAMQAHAISGTAVMMLLFGLAACGGTLLQESASGTLQRLQLAPTPGISILLGKVLYTGIAGLLQLVILFTYGALVFDIPVLRDPVTLVVHSLAVVCAATGVGVLLAVLCRTQKQLEGLSTLIILVMSALGGSWFPLVITPEWFQRLGHFTLNAWAMDGYQAIFWYGKGLSGVWLPSLVLMGIAVLTVTIAASAWRRRFEVSR